MSAEFDPELTQGIFPFLNRSHREHFENNLEGDFLKSFFIATEQQMITAITNVTVPQETLAQQAHKMSPEQKAAKAQRISDNLLVAVQFLQQVDDLIPKISRRYPEHQSRQFDRFKEAAEQLRAFITANQGWIIQG